MPDALDRLRSAVRDVSEAARTDNDKARDLWRSYVLGAWTSDVGELSASLTQAQAA